MGMMREVEAKFRVGSGGAFQKLLELEEIGGYELEPGPTKEVYDRYVDTDEHDFLNADFACRLRRRSGEELVTIKGLVKASGEVHRRDEYEAPTGGHTSPQDWPDSEAKELAIEVSCGARLKELSVLFTIEQVRHKRMAIAGGGRMVAEVSLDEVDFGDGEIEFVMEVELLEDGTEEDLHAISSRLQEYPPFELTPEPLSKFERAVEKLGLRL